MGSGTESQQEDAGPEINDISEGISAKLQQQPHTQRGNHRESFIKAEKTISRVRIPEFSHAAGEQCPPYQREY